jgi:hypothetical protein
MPLGRAGAFILGNLFRRYSDHSPTVARSEASKTPVAYQVAHRSHRNAPPFRNLFHRERAGKLLFNTAISYLLVN